jgi:hypothetical protein
LVVHAALFAAVARREGTYTADGKAGEAPALLALQTIELASEEPPSPASKPPSELGSAPSRRVASDIRSAVAPGVSSARSAAPPTVESAARSDSGPNTTFEFNPYSGLSPDAVGLGGRNVFLGGTSAPAVEEGSGEEGQARIASRALQQKIRQELHDDDVAHGLGSGGPVVNAAEELVRGSDVPVNARARLEVTTDAAGAVTAIRVLGENADREAWESVARRLVDGLRTRALHVPSGSRGVTIVLEVTSRWLLPSGTDPRAPFSPHFGSPAGGVTDVEYGTSPIARSSIAFDVTDFVPRPSRVVHAHVVREDVR